MDVEVEGESLSWVVSDRDNAAHQDLRAIAAHNILVLDDVGGLYQLLQHIDMKVQEDANLEGDAADDTRCSARRPSS